MITWGLVTMAMIFIQGEISFYVLRFLLGLTEAGFSPGIILYLSYFSQLYIDLRFMEFIKWEFQLLLFLVL